MLYNEVVDLAVRRSDIVRLRDLHVALDEAVALAYRWDKLISAYDDRQRSARSRAGSDNGMSKGAEGGPAELMEVAAGLSDNEEGG